MDELNDKSDYNSSNNFKFQIGDVVTFPLKDSFFNITGEIRRVINFNEKTIIKIYDFFSRKEKFYYLTENKEFLLLKKLKKRDNKNKPIIYDFENKTEYIFKNKIIVSIIILLILLSIVSSYFIYLRFPDFITSSATYEKFLNKKMSITDLYKTVTDRISYRYDLGEKWLKPKTAWDTRYGDCEDFSVVTSDYLNFHKIENYIVGVYFPGNSTGHAMVIAKTENTFWVIDLTRAVEQAGYKKFINIKNIEEIIKKYTQLNAEIFKIPSYDGEKEKIGVIYINSSSPSF